TQGKGESATITSQLNAQGFAAIDLTHDDLAKDHIRYMIGGTSALASNERLLSFVFPERPGALLKFLSLMNPEWNISLFHYRNQGADYGRVLVGIQVPPEQGQAFDEFAAKTGYPYVEATNSAAYTMFLKGGN
ncbi:MAG: threonine ammonia-lyase, biosynthetic, partial [Brachymonas sp.]|nr:threonine ammonia-lyase, biosynthetic [Brachymonas sp.]MBP6966304.1 threonine ammonia-lyase, biosynthetic [Brachymonas sp.]